MRPLRRLAGFGFAVNGVYRRHGQSRTGWHSAADPFGVWGRRVVAGLTCRRRQAQSQQALGAAATAARSALPFASDGRGTRSGLASNSNEAVSDQRRLRSRRTNGLLTGESWISILAQHIVRIRAQRSEALAPALRAFAIGQTAPRMGSSEMTAFAVRHSKRD